MYGNMETLNGNKHGTDTLKKYRYNQSCPEMFLETEAVTLINPKTWMSFFAPHPETAFFQTIPYILEKKVAYKNENKP